jgi:hypothetical protein
MMMSFICSHAQLHIMMLSEARALLIGHVLGLSLKANKYQIQGAQWREGRFGRAAGAPPRAAHACTAQHAPRPSSEAASEDQFRV